MRILSPGSSRLVPWKNGLGSTLEVASDAAEPGGAWTWRLSLAEVLARTPFSIFPGTDRCIACLSGAGLALDRAGARVPVPTEGAGSSFAGEEAVVGVPLGPGVRDANLMFRRDRWRGRLTVIRERGISLDAPLILLHSPLDTPTLRVAGLEGAVELMAGHTLIAGGPIVLAAAPGTVAVACELFPV